MQLLPQQALFRKLQLEPFSEGICCKSIPRDKFMLGIISAHFSQRVNQLAALRHQDENLQYAKQRVETKPHRVVTVELGL